MDYSCEDISAWPKEEYLVWIESVEYFQYTGPQFLQILVNKYGDNFKVKKLGDSMWHKPSQYGFYKETSKVFER